MRRGWPNGPCGKSALATIGKRSAHIAVPSHGWFCPPHCLEQERDIELWYKTYVARQLGLSDAQVILFAHQAQAGNVRSSYQAPRALDRFTFLNTTLDNDDTAMGMRTSFSTYLGAVAKATLEKSSADLEASLQVAER